MKLLSFLRKKNLFNSYCKLRCYCQVARLKQQKKQSRERQWESVIGLEVHAQIAASSKLFSGAENRFAAPINDCVSHFDAAMPGTLPMLNRRCVEAGVVTALALNCHINLVSFFDRKHYFYADLPAGYQITQQRTPLATGGCLAYFVQDPDKGQWVSRSARIIQVQLEQDSGKSLHDDQECVSLIDLNRAGVGLMEIVTEPDFRSGPEAAAFVQEIRQVLQAVGSCSCKMAEGALRVDASVSVRCPGEPLGERREVKNLNSIRFVEKAIAFEIEDQIRILEEGGAVTSETRSYDPDTEQTLAMRDKEKVHDYRFMPEPNLPPLRLASHQTPPPAGDSSQLVNVDELRAQLPLIPAEKRKWLRDSFDLPLDQCMRLVSEPRLYDFYVATLECGDPDPHRTSKLLLNDILGHLNRQDSVITDTRLKPEHVAELVDMLTERTISGTVANKVIGLVLAGHAHSPRTTVIEKNWAQLTDPVAIATLCDHTIKNHPEQVRGFHHGNKKLFKFLMGQVLRDAKGMVDPTLVSQILKDLLQKD